MADSIQGITSTLRSVLDSNMSLTTYIATTLDTFTLAYIDTALWCETDQSDESGGESFESNYVPADIHVDTLAQMIYDCAAFQAANQKWWLESDDDGQPYCLRYGPDYDETGHAGHDFWLTRNGHGAGFWDGDWSDACETILTDAADAFGCFDLYIGDDGLIHGSPLSIDKA